MRSSILAALVVVGCAQKSSAVDDGVGETTSAGETSTGDSTGGSGMTSSAGTTAGTTAPAETTTDDDPSVGFVLRPDTHAESECDPRAQDCPRGEKCTAWANDGGSSWNANKCVPVTGDGVDGDPCTVEGTGVSGIDDCSVGFMCWDVDPETSMGVCVAFCDPQGTCPTGTICAVQNDGVLPICITSCDPLIQDCPEGQGCYAKDGDNGELICIPDASGSGGLDGDPCEFDNVCDPGLVCIGGSAGCNSTWCCTPWCDLSLPNTCPGAGEECVPHFDDPPPGTEDVGICVVPS